MKTLAYSPRLVPLTVSLAIVPTLMIFNTPSNVDAATPTEVQSGDVGTSAIASGSPGTVLPSNATVGDTIVLAVLGSGATGQTVTSVTSPMGAFVKVNASLQPGQSDIELWVLSGLTAAGKTVTVAMSSGSAYFAQANEFSGALVVAANTATSGTGTNPNGGVTTPRPVRSRCSS